MTLLIASAPAACGNSKTAARRRAPSLRVCALAGVLFAAVSAEAAKADWLDDVGLRGSLGSKGYVRWDGVNLGAQIGVSNMNTDFGNSSSGLIAYSLRNTTVENEFQPSDWTTLPANTTNGRQYGAFLSYNWQWDQLVIGLDAAYNRASSSFQASATDSIARIVTTSDTYANTVIITASSSLKLIDYATLRARAGYAMGQFLPYAFVGAAVGRFNYATTATTTVSGTSATANPLTYGPITDTQSNSRNNAITGGIATGLGLDVAVLPNVFLRAEWEYAAFAPLGGIKATMNTGRVGVGVRF
jgi:opacity protein-like surface antigen